MAQNSIIKSGYKRLQERGQKMAQTVIFFRVWVLCLGVFCVLNGCFCYAQLPANDVDAIRENMHKKAVSCRINLEIDNSAKLYSLATAQALQVYMAVYRAAPQGSWDDEPVLVNKTPLVDVFPPLILTEGAYAIRLFVDINQNGVLDFNGKGIPLEPFGFSGHHTQRRAPTFSEATIDCVGTAVATIALRIPRAAKG